MVTMLDCIKRVPSILDTILEKKDETFAPLWAKYAGDAASIDEIVLIGSGTSSTTAQTAKYFAEKASGVRVTLSVPSEFLYSLSARNENALYVFISQTGTSSLTRRCLELVKKNGWKNAAISENAQTPIASDADVFIDMRCGKEEYPMRTIGYSSTVLTIMLLGMELGLKNGHLLREKYDGYLKDAAAASANIGSVIEKSLAWLEKSRRNMLQADTLIFYGSGALYGVALEGAVKVWETPQIVSIGYELEEGLHGPNFGYTARQCVVVLNDGGIENKKAVALGKYMKEAFQNGFIVGAGTLDEMDLPFDVAGNDFGCLEFAAVVQVICYHLAVMQGRDLFAPHDNSLMHKYLNTHNA